MKQLQKNIKPDLTEFVDDDGKKWVQTSTEDLFSVKELNDILESLEKEKDTGEIILARIDFQKVNKEYYERVTELESKLAKKNELLKRLIVEANGAIEKKNKKLKELIEYIKNLHIILAYHKLYPDAVDKIDLLPSLIYRTAEKPAADAGTAEERVEVKTKKISYAEVEEILLDDDGKEMGKA